MSIKELFSMLTMDSTPGQREYAVRLSFRALVLLHIVWACGWLPVIGIPLSGFAFASDINRVTKKVEAVEESISAMQRRQYRQLLEGEMRRLEQEIFTLEARIREIEATGDRPDQLYTRRLVELRADRTQTANRLNAFLRANPDILGDPL